MDIRPPMFDELRHTKPQETIDALLECQKQQGLTIHELSRDNAKLSAELDKARAEVAKLKEELADKESTFQQTLLETSMGADA